jgi:hypothetical protein
MCVAAAAILCQRQPAAGVYCVQDLHHPAMRERHWKMLMQTTGKHFVMDEKFCLGDLLALGLHNYVDACRCVWHALWIDITGLLRVLAQGECFGRHYQ